MVKIKELIICAILIIALVLTIATNVFATDSTYQDIMEAFNTTNNTTNTDTNGSEFQQIGGTTNNTINTTNTISTTNNSVNNTTNTMPDTGVSYSSLLLIAIAAVSAIYAYKKIREYNV